MGLLLIVTSFNTTSTSTNNTTITSGEKLTLVASYKMSGIMTDIAQINMETSTVKTKTRELLRLKCTASTYSKWDSYFRVRDLYESYVNPETLVPALFNRKIEEGTYKKELKYLFKRRSRTAVSTMNKKGYKDYKVNVPIDYNTMDIVSSIYKVRTLDFENFGIGQTTSLDFVLDSKVQTLTVKYLGQENINVANNGSKSCHKLSIGFGGKELENVKGGKYIWITADEDRLPALIKADIPLGAVQIRLSNFTK
ncbi:hypothetical protein LPB138_01770 [Urechidicola croceus]|uniref:DUF3108 domain-containing protein n=1 Tax=Urechidicola croceus TaxID=1850246 RepID=A0A1D8PBS8_9FLAO|nr:hypothetical protein LPB138_01770 [Urechidicola croceus]